MKKQCWWLCVSTHGFIVSEFGSFRFSNDGKPGIPAGVGMFYGGTCRHFRDEFLNRFDLPSLREYALEFLQGQLRQVNRHQQVEPSARL